MSNRLLALAAAPFERREVFWVEVELCVKTQNYRLCTRRCNGSRPPRGGVPARGALPLRLPRHSSERKQVLVLVIDQLPHPPHSAPRIAPDTTGSHLFSPVITANASRDR